MGFVYLLCFERPLGSNPRRPNRHYVGFAKSNLQQRIDLHRMGAAHVRFTEVAFERGIPFVVAASWSKKTGADERRLKSLKNAPRYCPSCRGAEAADPWRTAQRSTAGRQGAKRARVAADSGNGHRAMPRDAYEHVGDDVDLEDLPF